MTTPTDDRERKPTAMPLGYAVPSAKTSMMRKKGIAWALSVSFLLLLAIWIILRFVIGPREGAHIPRARNLRLIGQGIQMYAITHNHNYPKDFATLLATEDIPASAFVSRGSGDTPAAGATTQAVVADFAKPGHCSYLYFGAGLRDTDNPMTLVACEPLANQNSQGVYALFLDGHVDFVVAPEARKLIAAATTQPTIWWQTSAQ